MRLCHNPPCMPALTKSLALRGFKRYVQAGVVTATSEQPAYPASNLTGLDLWHRVWRSVQGVVSGVQLKLDLGAAYAIQGVDLGAVNFSDTCERSIVFSNASDLSSPVYTVARAAAFDLSLPTLAADVTRTGRHLTYLHAPGELTVRYVGITIWDTANVWGFLRAAFALAEPVFQPLRNMEKGWERASKLMGDPGVEQALRQVQIPLPSISQAEERKLLSLARAWKSTGRLMVSPQPLSPATWPQDQIWGTFGGPVKAVARDQGGRIRTTALSFQEVNE